jgi:tripartite-type tricarboxylate transporter receptor subunit TctC
MLRQPFVVENRPGGAGTIGSAAAARAAPDGYTLLYASTSQTINQALNPNQGFDMWRDLRPVFLAAIVPNLLVANNATTPRSLAEVIAITKATPGGLDIGTSPNGSVQHMALELFRQVAKVPVNHVPYRGGGPLLNDVIAGQIGYGFSNASGSTAHVKAGSLRAICHTGSGRLPELPDVPPMSDTLPGVEANEWNGLFFPAGVPDAAAIRLSEAMNEVIAAPAVLARLTELNVGTRRNTPAQFAEFLQAEWEKWSRVVREGNIRIG